MNATTLIPVLSGTLNNQPVQLVDARLLHNFLESRQDFSNWIRNRICKYEFEEGTDYLANKIIVQFPHRKGLRSRTVTEYQLTLDMAKELAMVERTPRGRQARRYFIDCERQLKAMRNQCSIVMSPTPNYPIAIDLLNADIQAINRQAWADVAGENTARFHARREELLRKQRQLRNRALMQFHRSYWAR